MKKSLVLASLFLLGLGSAWAQRQMETLDRGLVAIKVSNGVYTSWRIPGEEYYDVKYNLYRDGALVASNLNVSNYVDAGGSLTSTYTVAPVVNGTVGEKCAAVSVWKDQYFQIDLQPVYNPKTGRDITSVMDITDGTVADLDGDGQYELIIERQNLDFTIGNDSAYSRFEAYEFDGTKLWEINLGPNMRDGNGSENGCFAFDFDEDGRAEVIFRGADGTILPDGTVLGNATVNYRDGQTGSQAYMVEGDEFIVMLDGYTGKTLDYQIFDANDGGYNKTTNNKTPPSGVYEPGSAAPGNNLARRSFSFWYGGSTKSDGGHRATKFHFGAPYLDGRHPSVFLGRGCYTNYHAAAWDVVNKKLKLRWACAVDDPSSVFYGQGYHNFTIADVDMDGRDEICHGNMVVDEFGKFHSSADLGHGDAQHYGDLDPFRDGVEGFRCLEDNPGAVFVDANTNEILFRWKRATDNGRCLAGNFTDDFPGAELWTTDGKLWSASLSRDADATVASSAPGVTMNARIYWDGDILEESMDYVSVSNYQGYDMSVRKYNKAGGKVLFATSGCLTINSTKGNPCVQADIFGDWREEFILPTVNNRSVRIYTTVDPTDFRIYTLMHDPQYRQAIYWQPSGYNQPPHVSYFLGNLEGILLPPPPSVTNGKQMLGTSLTSATNNQFVLGCETTNTTVTASGSVSPSYLQINSPADYTITGGSFIGNTSILKQGQGTLTLSGGTYNHTGNTEVWYGTLNLSNAYTTSPLMMKRFSKVNSNATLGGVTMEYGATLYPGNSATIGNLTAKTVDMQGGAIIEFDIQNDGSAVDQLVVDSLILGDANCIGATPTFYIRRTGAGTLTAGEYTLITANKGIKGDVSKITVDGLKGLSASLKQDGNKIVLVVESMRVATEIVYSGSGDWDLNKTESFMIDDQKVSFVTGDFVTIDASAGAVTINVAEDVEPGSLTILGTYNVNIKGDGKIGGACKLIKKGSGTLTIANVNNYTGGTLIQEGTVKISSIADLQNDGALGAYSPDEAKIVIETGARLWGLSNITNPNAIVLGDSSIIYTAGSWNQQTALSGGKLVKQGNGAMSFETTPTAKIVEIQAGTFNTNSTVNNCLGDSVILRGGTLHFDDSSYSYGTQKSPWIVPEGCSATVSLDRRCDYYNTLKGSGTLTLNLPNDTSCPRTTFRGDWSGFEGTVNFKCGTADRPFSLNNTYGMPKATMNIEAASVVQLGGDNVNTTGSFTIGALTGSGTLQAGASSSNSFNVGSLNTDFTFAGISNATINKVGTGTMSMTKNTGSGPININEGAVRSYNSASATSTGTGTGLITVNKGGTVTGRGFMGNKIVVKSGGVFAPGNSFASKLTVNGQVEIQSGGTLQFRLNGVSAATPVAKLTINSALLLKGNLEIFANEGVTFKEGDTYDLYSCTKYSSNTSLAVVTLPELPEGLVWDTSELLSTNGKLTVKASTAVNQLQYDSPVQATVYAVDGTVVANYDTQVGLVYSRLSADSNLPKGVYIVLLKSAQGMAQKKYIKR